MQTEYLKKQILVVDNDHSVILSLLHALGIDPGQICVEHEINSAMDCFERVRPELVIVTLEPSRLEGMQLISQLNEQNLPIAIIAAAYDVNADLAASAIRSGATDILDLSLSQTHERLERRIKRALSLIEEQQILSQLGHPLFDETRQEFIGSSQVMQEVTKLIINAAKSNASVFITGENGTGKEVCAEMIHRYSQRQAQQLVTLNCAAIPSSLAESEMFGHVKGAFTGAVSDRDGVARQADKGTLFLDEIGEMEMDIQSKLLRFVQTGVFNPVGSGQADKVDVRFICATNRDPQQQIIDGSFRQDLFYRLNVIQIHLPPLRARGNDVLILADRFLRQFSAEENKQFEKFSPETERLLTAYTWPGNIRELQNVVRNIAVLYDGEAVIPSMLPLAIIRETGDRRKLATRFSSDNDNMLEKLKKSVQQLSDIAGQSTRPDEIRPLDEVIARSIKQAIDLCEGNITEASQKLGVSPATIYRKIKS